MTYKRANDEDLAAEAALWDSGKLSPVGWEDAPDAVPRASESMQINIRFPRAMVEILKEFASRSGVGYQVLMKRWLDERIRSERDKLRREHERLRRERERMQRPPIITLSSPTLISQAAVFDASGIYDLTSNPAPDGVPS